MLGSESRAASLSYRERGNRRAMGLGGFAASTLVMHEDLLDQPSHFFELGQYFANADASPLPATNGPADALRSAAWCQLNQAARSSLMGWDASMEVSERALRRSPSRIISLHLRAEIYH
jgi:hypothetical protein